MIGDEARVVDAYCDWLAGRGWTIEREVSFADVLARRDGRRIVVEAKGRTASPGLDVDTLYGQLLRRMPGEAVGHDTFAVVVPEVATGFAERVSVGVRRALNIHIYAVSEDNTVNHVGDDADPAS